MIRNITRFALAALIGGAFLGGSPTAQAQNYPISVGTGENSSVNHGPGPARNIVGGALYRVVSGGESVTVEAIQVDHVQRPREGRVAVTVGSGENSSVVFVAPGGRAG